MPVTQTPLSTFPPTTASDNDTYLVVVQDPSGTPVDKLLKAEALIAAYTGGGSKSTPVVGVTTLVVAHGQSFTPGRVLLFPAGAALAAILLTAQWYVDPSSINGTNFTINFTSAVTGNLEFVFQCFK